MIELATASGHRRCAAQLTINEAEILQTALDSLIFDAAMRNGAANGTALHDHSRERAPVTGSSVDE